jgi:excisionase family DNA binding protein
MTDNNEHSLVLTVSEAAKLLRLSRGSAYEGIRLGQIPSIRIGRRLLVPRRALEKLLEGVPQNGQGLS